MGDDGQNNNVWTEILIGVGANQQGADYGESGEGVFTGRLRLFGPSGSRFQFREA